MLEIEIAVVETCEVPVITLGPIAIEYKIFVIV